MSLWDRVLVTCAGLLGAAGLAAGAAGTHVGGGDLARLASEFLLFHAAAVLGTMALGQWLSRRVIRVAATLLVVGVASFSGDLAVLAFAQSHAVAALAPVGGLCLIAGWLCVAVSPFVGFRANGGG